MAGEMTSREKYMHYLDERRILGRQNALAYDAWLERQFADLRAKVKEALAIEKSTYESQTGQTRISVYDEGFNAARDEFRKALGE
jgi:Tfp pilus assembly protein PilF